MNFFWSPFPTKRSTKTPRKIRGKFGAKFGARILESMQNCCINEKLGDCEGSRVVVLPRFLTPYRLKSTTSRDPYPFASAPPPHPPVFGKESLFLRRGKGSRLERGSLLVVFPRPNRRQSEKATNWDPLSSRSGLPKPPVSKTQVSVGGAGDQSQQHFQARSGTEPTSP